MPSGRLQSPELDVVVQVHDIVLDENCSKCQSDHEEGTHLQPPANDRENVHEHPCQPDLEVQLPPSQ